MAHVTVELPSMLTAITGAAPRLPLEAATVREALRRLVEHHATLAVHLFDERGDLREHVLCYHNDVNTRWMDTLDTSLADGDTLTILQAVSGG